MIFPELNDANVALPAKDAKIKSTAHAAEIIRLIIELKSNDDIIAYMADTFGKKWDGSTLKRKFTTLLQGFIIQNYLEDFNEFCRLNGIAIFNEDLDVAKENATYARIVFIVFLRESLMVRRSMDVKCM